MKRFLILIVVVFVGVVAWRVSDDISHDAVIMSIGVLFGVMAGIPAALLVVASQRRQNADAMPAYRNDYRPQQSQQPIIVLGNPQHQGQGYQQPYQPQHTEQAPPWGATGGGNYNMLPGPQDGRYSAEDEARRKWGDR